MTLWNTVPALMEMLVGYSLGRRQRLPDSLRLVLLSGDWIPLPLPERIRSIAAEDIEVISLGGATEGSIWSIYHRIAEIDPAWVSVPYGTPLDNQQIEVLDDALRRRPDWVPGEQYIGGHGVAMGTGGTRRRHVGRSSRTRGPDGASTARATSGATTPTEASSFSVARTSR